MPYHGIGAVSFGGAACSGAQSLAGFRSATAVCAGGGEVTGACGDGAGIAKPRLSIKRESWGRNFSQLSSLAKREASSFVGLARR